MIQDVALRPLERITTFTTLGMRFWDAALDQHVRDGLVVTARPATRRVSHVRTATCSMSGVYALSGLPGLRDVEHGLDQEITTPAERLPFVIEVRDSFRRYVSIAFDVELPLPYRGVFLMTGAQGSPELTPPGVLLFSSASRRRPTWFGAVIGELIEAATGRPAAHALIAATDPNGEVWHGIADEAGRYAVWMAYPAVDEVPATSPPTGAGLPLLERSWPVRIQVFYSPGTRRPLPGTDIPDYESVLSQDASTVWLDPPSAGGVEQPEWTGDLRVGRELNPRTTGMTQLLVGPETTSP